MESMIVSSHLMTSNGSDLTQPYQSRSPQHSNPVPATRSWRDTLESDMDAK